MTENPILLGVAKATSGVSSTVRSVVGEQSGGGVAAAGGETSVKGATT